MPVLTAAEAKSSKGRRGGRGTSARKRGIKATGGSAEEGEKSRRLGFSFFVINQAENVSFIFFSSSFPATKDEESDRSAPHYEKRSRIILTLSS